MRAFKPSGNAIFPAGQEREGHRPSLIEGLPDSARDAVQRHGTVLQFKRGDSILKQGAPHDGIVVIESGMVRSFYTSPAGRSVTLAYWLPGNFVGGPDIFGGGQHMWSAAAERDTVVTMLPAQGLRDLARDVPDLALAIIDALAFKARCYSSLAQMLGTKSLIQRMSQLLVHLARTYGLEEETGGIVIAAAFTHAEIAGLIGGTRQWVTISLNRLQKAGIITQRRGILIVHDLEALSATAAVEDDA